MKPSVGSAETTPEERDALRRHLLSDNIRRGRVLAILIILFEACLILADVGASTMKADHRFQFSAYLATYLVMLAANLAYFHFLSRAGLSHALPDRRVIRQEGLLTAYVTLMMCWGSVVSLMDQRLYGNLMAFMVNMITCSVIYSLPARRMLIPYVLSVATLAGLLPFFQRSGDVLVGHYINLVIFIAVSWAASRVMYNRHIADYKNTLLLQRANGQLEQEIERNRRMNLQLADANQQLSKLSLLDELTGLPNRRSFRHFIDRMFERPDIQSMPFSVLMIDLDNFKQYNDACGHGMGDDVLIAVAAQIEAVVQHTTDAAARWGGEEFIYAAFGMGMPEIRAVAETIQTAVNGLAIPQGQEAAQAIVTVSIGSGTVIMQEKSDVARCVDRADKAMYRAKAEGRNRIVMFEDGV